MKNPQAPGARGEETSDQGPGVISSTGKDGRATWEISDGTSINAKREWSLRNRPNSVGWNLCPPQFLDAVVISVIKYRRILRMAEQVLYLYGGDYDCRYMPPHCILIKRLLEFARDLPRDFRAKK
jgi:hypothetical protein